MHLRITADSNSETKVSEIISNVSGPTREKFLEKNYGSSIEGILIVFMCRDKDLDFKQRVNFSKEDKKLSLDIMLDYDLMVSAPNTETRFGLMKENLISELSQILEKYKFSDFDQEAFISDIKNNLTLSV